MYNFCALYKKYLGEFEKLNSERKDFNELNEDFFQEYNALSYPFQILLLKKVKLLQYNSNFIGYYWINSKNKFCRNINALSIDTSFDIEKAFIALIANIKGTATLKYSCIKNDFNFDILERAGFYKGDGTLDMEMLITEKVSDIYSKDISFRPVKKGVDEKIRCTLQNDIFKNADRLPLTVDDIFYDELQSYYLNDGSILMKFKDIFIGYGQIILEYNKATIVNFGIIKSYRNLGLGKMLLIHLLNIIRKNNFGKAYIKVKATNEAAVKLYSYMGFKITSENYDWYLKRY